MSKLALVTGGIRGIGEEITIALKQKGYEVIANYHQNHELAEQFSKKHSVTVMSWDVSNFEECKKNIEQIVKKHGKSISILINNAGITQDSMMHKMQPEQWNQVININLTSCFNMARNVIENMRNENFGRIVNISSVNAQSGQVGQTNYSASKAGIIGFTKALAKESAPKGITVNCIAPGYIDTDMMKNIPQKILDEIINQVPVKRLGLPQEIARTILFLVDDNAGFITGETISVNGGYYMI